ncbi:MAG: response regulator [Desulfobacterales bacterium]|nr:response regulator [Desulfobacterales bacterium]
MNILEKAFNDMVGKLRSARERFQKVFKSLEKSEEKFRTLYERAVEGIFRRSPEGGVLSANPAMVEFLGYDSEADIIASASDFSKSGMAPDYRKKLLRDLANKDQVAGFEAPFQRKGGGEIWGSVSTRSVRDPGGEVVYYEGVVVDITEQKRTEKAERDRELAEAGARAKSEFLANMSHEIRTPMNAILGMGELLEETGLSLEQKDFVSTLNSSGELLLSLINDILDFSKIEAGQIELENIRFDMCHLVETVGRILAVRAHEKGLEIACRVAPNVHPYRLGDPTRLRQILINLLGNGIKFTSRGEVMIDVFKDPDADDPDVLRFCVKDTGVGISREIQEEIFKSFSQADASTTRKFGGTGLGLAITKSLVTLMRGRIWVESRPGEGSRFLFTIPFPQTDKPRDLTPSSPAALKNKRILVVDDNATNRRICTELLSRWGVHPMEAESGERALQALVRSDGRKTPYHIVLLDLMMPDMHGFKVIEQMNALTLSAPPMVIILASSENMGDRSNSRDLNVSGYIMKPFTRTDLLDGILTSLGKKEAEAEAVEKQDGMTVLPPARILLVEDIEANRKVVRLFLRNAPIRMDVAENGKIACEKFFGGSYDIVLMDIQMPVMDGYQATRKIRAWEAATGAPPTPIIALTAHAFKKQRQQCREAGCTDFLLKPVKKTELLAALEKHFGVQKADGKPGPPAAAARRPSVEEVAAGEAPGGRRAYSARVNVIYKELFPELLEVILEDIQIMNQAVKNEDFDTIKRLGHGLKGASGNCELFELADLFLAAENGARSGDVDTIEKNIELAVDYINLVEIEFVEEE